jgi:hypothetical protein
VLWTGEVSLFDTDARGFADVPTTGTIGPYPFRRLTLTLEPKDGKAEAHELKPSISPR